MFSDFYAGVFVARQLEGVKFALGPTIATTRTHLAGFGGYASIENRPADDLLVGRMIAEQGYRVELLPYAVGTVPDYKSLPRPVPQTPVRWIRGDGCGICGPGDTWACSLQGITLVDSGDVVAHPTAAVAVSYLGAYLGLRIAMTWVIGVRGLNQNSLKRSLALIPAWDALAFLIWLASFARRSIRWRGSDYLLRGGLLVPRN